MLNKEEMDNDPEYKMMKQFTLHRWLIIDLSMWVPILGNLSLIFPIAHQSRHARPCAYHIDNVFSEKIAHVSFKVLEQYYIFSKILIFWQSIESSKYIHLLSTFDSLQLFFLPFFFFFSQNYNNLLNVTTMFAFGISQ